MAETRRLENPFVGLRAFEQNEDENFFGRDTETNDLLQKFGKTRLLAVIGSSGSGKSSLVKCGLLPAIHSGFLSAGCNWHVALFRPGNDPIVELTKALAKEGILYKKIPESKTPTEAIIDSTLRRSSNGLIQAYKQAYNKPESKKTENLLIVADQFEELFRYSKTEKQKDERRSEAKQFVDLLLEAAQQTEYPVYILLTMRSDFIGDCAAFRGLPEAINEGQYLVPRMTREEFREAITGPIVMGGAKITPQLVTRLLNDIGNDIDQLPIMQHAMMRTWDYWQKKNTPNVPIDLSDYRDIGTMSAALSNHADEAYNELSSEQKKICELMFKALTDKAADIRGIRRPQKVSDLSVLTDSDENKVIEVVEVFRKKGRTFLMPAPDLNLTNASWIDISHESLMRVWERLKAWADDEVRQANVYKRLGNAALNYETIIDGIRQGSLWQDPELGLAIKWKGRFKNNEVLETWAKSFDVKFDQAIEFLKNSEAQAKAIREKEEREIREKQLEQKRRLKRARITAIVISGLLVVALGVMGYAFHLQGIANKAKIEASNQRDSAQTSLENFKIARAAKDSIQFKELYARATTILEVGAQPLAILDTMKSINTLYDTTSKMKWMRTTIDSINKVTVAIQDSIKQRVSSSRAKK